MYSEPLPRLERSVLSLPALDWTLIQSATRCPCDAVMLDLDDTVPLPYKVTARAMVVRALQELEWGRVRRIFRMNAVNTMFAYSDLIQVVEAAGSMIDAVVVPKVSDPADVHFVDRLLAQLEAQAGLDRPIGIQAQIETAMGMVRVNEIAFASPRLEALVFGPGDYASSLQMPTEPHTELDGGDGLESGNHWDYALHRVLVAARAAKLLAIDGPSSKINDPEGFRQSTLRVRRLGYDGKWCVNQDQVALANQLFVPSQQETEHAQQLLLAYEEGIANRQAIVIYDGSILDAARIELAHRTLERARRAALAQETSS